MTVVLRNVFDLYCAPGRLFRRFDETTPYGAALCLLVFVSALIGYVVVASALVEREVDESTERSIAHWEKQRRGEVPLRRLRQEMREMREASSFWNIVNSGWSILRGPAAIIVRVFIGAGVVYVIVALSGRKPVYALLVAIFVYAAYTELLRDGVQLGLMLHQWTTSVDTSLAAFLRPMKSVSGFVWLPLRAAEPFAIWFWCLVAAGVVITEQLSLRRAVLICGLLGVVEGLGRAGVSVLADLVQRSVA